MQEKNRRKTLIERIQSRIKLQDLGHTVNGQPSLCHIWTGSHSGNGRGGEYEGFQLDSTFWDKFAIVMGIERESVEERSFFTCSC